MIHTSICDILRIRHPVVLGGMAGGHTSVQLAAAISNAGGLGTLGLARTPSEKIAVEIRNLRAATAHPFGVNFLLFDAREAAIDEALEERPPVFAAAWARPDQDIKTLFTRVHDAGCVVMYQVSTVAEALRGTAAGADILVAQGTEGGGHVGWMTSMTLLPMVVDAVGSTPVLAAGGFADGRGLAAALALGAQGVLLGTRFLATKESPLHPNFKQALLESHGHDTVLTEIPDLARGSVWPGAMSRVRRNAFIERWAGREWELRAHQPVVLAALQKATAEGDATNASLFMGQDAGLIRDIPAAGELVERIVAEAEVLLQDRLPMFVSASTIPSSPKQSHS
jgi:NAD(P)H-dependent flavin oxidoreductase YrpB (nitropropane dioxygenase family)